MLLSAAPALARSDVPLPRPRPAAAPARAVSEAAEEAPGSAETRQDAKAGEGETTAPAEARAPAAPGVGQGAAQSGRPGVAAAPAGPVQSPCRLALTDEIAVAPSIAPIRGPGACGGEDLVRLEAVVVDGHRVALKPAAILRCTMARAVADWVRADMAPLAVRLGSTVSEVDNFDSFECRGRNRVVGAKLSEHGRANALDVRGVRLASGRFISLTDRAEPRPVREAVLQSVCARFATVLGPGSDWYHEDHIHLDLAERRGGFRMCQWNVYDPLPAVAPLLPAERPLEAPPREVAEEPGDKAGAHHGHAGSGDAAPAQDGSVPAAETEQGGEAEQQVAEPPPAARKPAKKSARKRTPPRPS